MFQNLQPPEKSVSREDGSLDVFDIWDTIQGEGPFQGVPATFIRLAGCNLACLGCDTDYTTKRRLFAPSGLVDEIWKLPRRKLIVVTGGEPFRQDLTDFFCEILMVSDSDLQVETNGTIDPGDRFWNSFSRGEVTIVCSPKTSKIAPTFWPHIDALKYVVEADKVDEMGFPLSSVGPQYGAPARPPEDWNGEIYISPLDEQDPEKNIRNRQTAVESCMRHGYRLSLQIHKIVGLP